MPSRLQRRRPGCSAAGRGSSATRRERRGRPPRGRPAGAARRGRRGRPVRGRPASAADDLRWLGRRAVRVRHLDRRVGRSWPGRHLRERLQLPLCRRRVPVLGVSGKSSWPAGGRPVGDARPRNSTEAVRRAPDGQLGRLARTARRARAHPRQPRGAVGSRRGNRVRELLHRDAPPPRGDPDRAFLARAAGGSGRAAHGSGPDERGRPARQLSRLAPRHRRVAAAKATQRLRGVPGRQSATPRGKRAARGGRRGRGAPATTT